MMTGQRTSIPCSVAKGGTAASPGVRLRKTVISTKLASGGCRHLVYIAAVSRKEMTDVLREFLSLSIRNRRDAHEAYSPLANMSDMPVAARGLDLYRYHHCGVLPDMGYDVSVIADSTSRWPRLSRDVRRLRDARRRGYPAYLSSRLAIL